VSRLYRKLAVQNRADISPFIAGAEVIDIPKRNGTSSMTVNATVHRGANS
jgi:hypothetical protein